MANIANGWKADISNTTHAPARWQLPRSKLQVCEWSVIQATSTGTSPLLATAQPARRLKEKDMRTLIGSLTALALIATPAVAAQTTNKAASTKTVVTKSGKEKATTTVSTKGNTTVAKTTVTKRHHKADRHAARCGCPSHKMKSHRSGKARMKKSTTTTEKKTTK